MTYLLLVVSLGLHPYSLAPGSDWDLRLLHERRETLALYSSGTPARLVFLPFINYLSLLTSDRHRATPPTNEDRERLGERLPGNSAIRATKQQVGASPVTAEAIGRGSATLVG